MNTTRSLFFRHLALVTLTTLGLCSGGAMAAQTAAVPECHHDTAQVDPGLYVSDLMAGNVVAVGGVQTWIVSKGTKVTMTYKVRNEIRSVECITAEPRAVYKNKLGEFVDARCGNVYRAGVSAPSVAAVAPPAVASAPAVAVSAVCMDDGCGNLTVTNTVTHVTRRVELQTCQGSDVRIPIGQACPEITLTPTRVVVPPAQVHCQNCDQRPAPQVRALCGIEKDGTVACRGVPPANCGCFLSAVGNFLGAYFPDVQTEQACTAAKIAFAKVHSLRLIRP